MTRRSSSARLILHLGVAVHLVAGFLGLLVFWSTAAAAAVNLHEQLPAPAWVWSLARDYDLPGAHIQVRRFQASVAPADAARHLAAASPLRFTRLQLLGPSLWLSGLQDGKHWMAHLRGNAGGTVGLVSSLAPQADAAVSGAEVQSLVPCPATPVIRMASRDPAGATLLRVACPGTAPALFERLAQRLRAAHWEPESGSKSAAADGIRHWQHPSGASLTVLSQVRASDVWLTLWHRFPEHRP